MPNELTYTKGARIWLKDHPQFDEAWLKKVIAQDPSILGLGDLVFKDSERMHPKAGRLDLLLQDPESDKRYVVEIMLGRVDESHIIRCLEYWDIERKRSPSYDHCAVLVAEETTSRFLNVISLFNRTVPLIALQMNAIQLDNKIVLSFTKVIDEVSVVTAEDAEEAGTTDRACWEERGSSLSLKLLDDCLAIIREVEPRITPSYHKDYIGLQIRNRANNFIVFRAQKNFLRADIRLRDLDGVKEKLSQTDLEVLGIDKRWNRLRFTIREGEVSANREFWKQVFSESYKQSLE